MRASTPVAGDGISTSTLSVVTSQIVSSAATVSPTDFRHSRMVPSLTLMPIWGIATWTLVSVAEELIERLLHVAGLGQDSLLERRAERDGNIGCGQPPDRGIQMLERMLRDERRNFGADAARASCLVRDEDLAGLS